jgi:PAS domain-containing protein
MNNNLSLQLGSNGNGNDLTGKLQRSQTGASATDQSGLIYDFSSFDPLQAHARQLTASAGLTSVLPNQAAPPQPNQKTHPQPPMHPQQVAKSQLQQQQQQHMQPPSQLSFQQAPQAQAQSRTNPYYYMQTSNNPAASLPSIAPGTQQTVASAMMSQAPMMGQTAQNFILPATSPAAALPMQSNFQGSIFPNTGLTSTNNAQGMIPGLLMTQPFQQQQQLMPSVAPKREDRQDGSSQGPRKKQRAMEPSIVSSGTSIDSSLMMRGGMSPEDEFMMDPDVDVSRMTPAERRRHERNMREQQRSYKISQQIKELREVLTDSNVPFKPNKYSILMSVVDYIKQLQARAIMLDAEHQKLITTIRETNEMVNSGAIPSSADDTDGSDPGSDSEMVFVQGLNYRKLFAQCPAALGIAALDGRILECNPEFELFLGFPREDLMKHSLFNLIQNHQDIFRAMAEMLKFAEEEPLGIGRDSPSSGPNNCVWSGPVISKHDTKVRIRI